MEKSNVNLIITQNNGDDFCVLTKDNTAILMNHYIDNYNILINKNNKTIEKKFKNKDVLVIIEIDDNNEFKNISEQILNYFMKKNSDSHKFKYLITQTDDNSLIERINTEENIDRIKHNITYNNFFNFMLIIIFFILMIFLIKDKNDSIGNQIEEVKEVKEEISSLKDDEYVKKLDNLLDSQHQSIINMEKVLTNNNEELTGEDFSSLESFLNKDNNESIVNLPNKDVDKTTIKLNNKKNEIDYKDIEEVKIFNSKNDLKYKEKIDKLINN